MATALRVLLSRLLGPFRQRRFDREMDEEFRSHLEMLADRFIDQGMTRDEALRAAKRQFGGTTQLKERLREQNSSTFLDSLWLDTRYALRQIRKSPGFAATAVLTLAIGIGANTGLFMLVDTLLLRPVPVQDPWSLYQVFGQLPDRTSLGGFSPREYQAVLNNSDVFSQVIADAEIRARNRNRTMGGYAVSGNYFLALGGSMVMGRPIVPDDDTPSAPPVVVLGYSYWQKAFNADTSAIGSTIDLSGSRFTIVGVASPQFTGIDAVVPDFWVPNAAKRLLAGANTPAATTDDERSLRIIGRLRPGITVAQAQSAISTVLPAVNQWRSKELRVTAARLESRARYQSWNHADRANVLPVVTAFALILLIACTNLSNVLLARCFSRSHEIGVRLALGASRARIVRQLVTETAVLSAIAGGAGLMISLWSWQLLRHVIVSVVPMKLGMPIFEITLDYRVFLFAFGLSLITGFAFGLTPAMHATRSTANSDWHSDGTLLGGRFRRSHLRDGLVIAQFSLSLVLLIGAGLLLRSTIRFASVQPGFDVAHVISIQPIQGTFQPDSLIAARLVERLKTIPGVRTVALARREPLRGSLPVARVSIGKQQSETLARYNEVTSAYFSTLGIPIVRGRSFTEQETAAGDAAVAVISEATAKRFWPGEDPIGKTIDMATTQYSSGGREALVGSSRTVRVIGVARDVISAWLWDGIDRTCIYLPATTSNAPYYSMLLSVRSDASLFQTELRSLLGSFDPVSDFDVRTMADVMDLQILPFRLASWGAAALGLLGLALASIGIYGVMAYVVNQRTREIAIRIAVGGGPGRVLWMILRDGLRLIAIAAAAGLTIALAFSRLIRAMLFRVDAADPLTFVVAPVVLGMVGLIAIYLASRKATRVDPNVTLRAE